MLNAIALCIAEDFDLSLLEGWSRLTGCVSNFAQVANTAAVNLAGASGLDVTVVAAADDSW